MKNVRLLFALILVGVTAACSASEPTGPLPQSPRNSTYAGGGNGTPADSTSKSSDPTKQGG